MAKRRALFRRFEHQFKLCMKLETKRMKDRYRYSWISHWRRSGMNNTSSGMLPVVSHLEIRTKRSQFDFTLENCVSYTRLIPQWTVKTNNGTFATLALRRKAHKLLEKLLSRINQFIIIYHRHPFSHPLAIPFSAHLTLGACNFIRSDL